MSNRTPINTAVVGLGVAAHTIHLPVLDQSSLARMVSVYDVDPTTTARTAARYRDVTAAANVAEICSDREVRAVIVATPPDSHHQIGLALLDAGKAVLMEKPLAPTAREGRELTAASARTGLPLAVGHQKRFHPTLRVVRDLIASGEIGDAFYIGVHWATDVKLDPDGLIPNGYGNYRWRWNDGSVGGGIGQDHIPHYVDLARLWTGAEPCRVWAHHLNVGRDWLGWPADESVWEDLSLAVVEMDNGAVLRLETTVAGRSVSPLLGTGHGLGEWTEYGYVLGTRGKIVFDLFPWDSSETGRVALWQTDSAAAKRHGWTLIEQPEPIRTRGCPSGTAFETFSGLIEAFLSWVDQPGQRPVELADGADGAIAVAVVEAAYRSAESDGWVDVKEI